MIAPPSLELRSRARQIVTTVAERIWSAAAAIPPSGPRSDGDDRLPWTKEIPGGEDASFELSLADGYPAIALLFAELACHDHDWTPRLHHILRAATPRLASTMVGSLYNGALPVGFALHMAMSATGGYRSALERLHTMIASQISDRLESGSIRHQIETRGLSLMDYDLISGLSGTLRYLLFDPSKNADLISLLLPELVRLAHVDDGRPGWVVSHPPSLDSDPADFPHGHVNLGLAHGAAGILAAISLAAHAGVVVPGQGEAIETLGQWLLGQQLKDGERINWPPFIAAHQLAEVAPGTRQIKGWCYGIPGIARALQIAARVTGSPLWADEALHAMKSMTAWPSSDAAIVEPGLCHGWAGTMHVTWRFMVDSRAEALTDWVDHAALRTMDAFDAGARFGFRSPSGATSESQTWVDDGGFLTGAAGIALALHRYAGGDPPRTAWDAALLVT